MSEGCHPTRTKPPRGVALDTMKVSAAVPAGLYRLAHGVDRCCAPSDLLWQGELCGGEAILPQPNQRMKLTARGRRVKRNAQTGLFS